MRNALIVFILTLSIFWSCKKDPVVTFLPNPQDISFVQPIRSGSQPTFIIVDTIGSSENSVVSYSIPIHLGYFKNIDVDGDNQEDFRLSISSGYPCGGADSYSYVRITNLNANSFILCDTMAVITWTNFPDTSMFSNVYDSVCPKPKLYHDTIKLKEHFVQGNIMLETEVVQTCPGPNGFSYHSVSWYDKNAFIGIKCKNRPGWIRVGTKYGLNIYGYALSN